MFYEFWLVRFITFQWTRKYHNNSICCAFSGMHAIASTPTNDKTIWTLCRSKKSSLPHWRISVPRFVSKLILPMDGTPRKWLQAILGWLKCFQQKFICKLSPGMYTCYDQPPRVQSFIKTSGLTQLPRLTERWWLGRGLFVWYPIMMETLLLVKSLVQIQVQ